MPTPDRSAGRGPDHRMMPLATRLMPVATVDSKARTVEVVWTTGASVRRYDWWNERYYLEELSTDPSAVRMDRLNAGAPLLNTHNQWRLGDVLGVVEGATLENGEGRAVVRFSERAEVEPIYRDVQSGIIRNVSVGYQVHKMERIAPAAPGDDWIYRAIDWEPMEISLVPIGADPEAGTRGQPAQDPGHEARTFACEFIDVMPPAGLAADSTVPKENRMADKTGTKAAGTPAPQEDQTTRQSEAPDTQKIAADAAAAERKRASDIRTAVRVAKLPDDFAERAIEAGTSIDEVRAQIFTELAKRSEESGPSRSAAHVETLRDEQEERRSAMAEAVYHRAHPSAQLPEPARRYRGFTLVELARRSLEDQGLRTEGLSRAKIVAIAMGNDDAMGFRSMHGVSDFAVALGNTVTRTLRQAYDSAPRTFTAWARRGTLTDFRPATRVAFAGNLSLEKVNEFGEFHRGKLVDAGETIQLATYGKVIGLSRQAVINDDLDMFGRIPRMYARAAADFESDTVYSVLTLNANMADGTTLFHASHGNLGTGGVPSETTLSEMRKLMRQQKDPSGNNQPLNLTARTIVAPAALETTMQKLLQAVIIATKSADTNVFNGAYDLVIEPRLDAASATAWYGIADPDQIDTVEYAYLDGEEGLYTEQRMGFDVDGIEIKARLDFAAKAIDWRGLFKNAGA